MAQDERKRWTHPDARKDGRLPPNVDPCQDQPAWGDEGGAGEYPGGPASQPPPDED